MSQGIKIYKTAIEDTLILAAAKTLRALVRFLPFSVTLALAKAIGGSVVYGLSRRRKVAYKNLRSVFCKEKSRDDLKRIARASFENLAMSVVELLRSPEMDEAYFKKYIQVTGAENVYPYLGKRGIIFLTGHFGNWELMLVPNDVLKLPILVLARAQKHPRSQAFLKSLRERHGHRMIGKGMPIRELLKTLQENNIVGMVSDQDAGRQGVFVNFFDRLSSAPAGVANFATRTGAVIIPIFDFRLSMGKHRIEIERPILVPQDLTEKKDIEKHVLQEFSTLLEQKIRKTPDQWLWMHKRWKSTPDRFVLILNDGKAGHLNQSIAVFNAFKSERLKKGADECRTHLCVIPIRFKSESAKKVSELVTFIFQGSIPFKRWFSRQVLTKDSFDAIMKNYADVVISCGNSLLGVHLFASSENQAKSIVVMKPSIFSDRFDAVIVPRHDKPRAGQNIFVVDGALSAITPDDRLKRAEELKREFLMNGVEKKIGLLLGGDASGLKFSEKLLTPFLENIGRYCRDKNTYLLAATSRRTPPWADSLLKSLFGSRRHCPILVNANEANREGIVSGILGASDLLLVSAESVSMISEAVMTGKPVIVFAPAPADKMKRKHKEFLRQMASENRIILAENDSIYEIMDRLINSPSELFISENEKTLQMAIQRVS